MFALSNPVRCARPAVAQRPVAAPMARAPLAIKSRASTVLVSAGFAPPTVAETKAKFMAGYKKPIASIYSTVINELIVQQHFIRYNVNYQYNKIYALGFVSVFDQILESLTAAERAAIFKAYVAALGEDAETYRRDAASLEAAASSLSGPDGLTPDASGTDVQKTLAQVAEASGSGKLSYNKFFAIGLFRLLELTGAKEPAALERLVKSVNVAPEKVNRDLMLYKGILSKLSAAKELMKEYIERERKKQAEREQAKAAAKEPAEPVAQA